MSTIGSLMSILGQSTPTPYGDIQAQTASTRGRELSNETALIKLAELKRSQASEEMVMAAIQKDPELAKLFFGDSIMGGLGQPATGGMPAAPGTSPGPITQSPLGGGPSQQIPAYPDASRYANVSPQGGGPIPPDVMAQTTPTVTPPQQSIIAGLSGQPQGQAQAPRNPVLEMARTNPRVAMMMQQQIEGRQDAQMKRQEQQLKMGAATLGYVGQQAQGVTDQASLDAMRSDLQSMGLGKYAAQLPQFYSKEAMQPFIAKALDVEKSLTLQVQGIQAQAELKRAQMAGRVATTDQYLTAMGVTPGTEQPEDMQRAIELQNKHLAEIEAGKVNAQIVPGPGGEYWAVNPRTLEQRPVGGGAAAGGAGGTSAGGTGEQLRAPMTEGQSKTAVYTSTMQTGHDTLSALEKSGDYTSWKAPLAKLPGGKLLLSEKQKEYETAKGVFLTGLLRYQSAGQITPTEWKDYGELYFPEPDDPPSMVEFKRKNREAAIKTMGAALGRPLPGQQSGTQAQPTSQGSTGTGGQAGANTFNDADIAATMANPRNKGKTRQQIIDGLLAKGMTYR